MPLTKWHFWCILLGLLKWRFPQIKSGVPQKSTKELHQVATLHGFHTTRGISKIVIPANPEFRLDNVSPSRANHEATIKLADRLVAAEIRPASVVFAGDVRAIVGFSFIRRLSRVSTRFKEESCDDLRYTRYVNYVDALERVERFGMAAIHRYLNEKSGHRPTWHESSEVFVTRIEQALAREFLEPAVLIVPIEAMILVYYTRVVGVDRFAIPDDRKAWLPAAGAGVAIATDGTAVEFDCELNFVGHPAAV